MYHIGALLGGKDKKDLSSLPFTVNPSDTPKRKLGRKSHRPSKSFSWGSIVSVVCIVASLLILISVVAQRSIGSAFASSWQQIHLLPHQHLVLVDQPQKHVSRLNLLSAPEPDFAVFSEDNSAALSDPSDWKAYVAKTTNLFQRFSSPVPSASAASRLPIYLEREFGNDNREILQEDFTEDSVAADDDITLFKSFLHSNHHHHPAVDQAAFNIADDTQVNVNAMPAFSLASLLSKLSHHSSSDNAKAILQEDIVEEPVIDDGTKMFQNLAPKRMQAQAKAQAPTSTPTSTPTQASTPTQTQATRLYEAHSDSEARNRLTTTRAEAAPFTTFSLASLLSNHFSSDSRKAILQEDIEEDPIADDDTKWFKSLARERMQAPAQASTSVQTSKAHSDIPAVQSVISPDSLSLSSAIPSSRSETEESENLDQPYSIEQQILVDHQAQQTSSMSSSAGKSNSQKIHDFHDIDELPVSPAKSSFQKGFDHKFQGVRLGMVGGVNITRLSLGLYNLIIKHKIHSLTDIECHKNIHWTPQLVRRLEFDVPQFVFNCVEDVEYASMMESNRQIFSDEASVNFHVIALGLNDSELRNITRLSSSSRLVIASLSADHKRPSGQPQHQDKDAPSASASSSSSSSSTRTQKLPSNQLPYSQMYFSWRGFHDLGARRTWNILKQLSESRVSYIAFGNNRGFENDADHTRSKTTVLNTIRSPFYLNPPSKVLTDLTNQEWAYKVSQQLVFYEIAKMRPGVL